VCGEGVREGEVPHVGKRESASPGSMVEGEEFVLSPVAFSL